MNVICILEHRDSEDEREGKKMFFLCDSFVKLEPELMCVFGWSREH